MKKLLLVCTLLVATFSLTSCAINWFDRQIRFNVPWFVDLILVLAVIAVSMIFVLRYYSSKYRTCPKCNHRFKPKWYQCFGAVFVGEKNNSESSPRLFKCPNCKEKHVMPISYKQDEEQD